MTRASLVAFDLDGTLIDSRGDIVIAANRAFATAGLPALPEDRVGRAIGRGVRNLFRQLVPDVDERGIAGLVAAFHGHYSDGLCVHTRIYPGIEDVLASYADRPRVVLTNKGQEFADRLIDALGLRRHFAAVYGHEAFATHKPDPGPLREIAARWRVPVERLALVGDSIYDVTAARAAGALSVAVTWGYGDEAEVRAAGPDFIVDSPRGLIDLI